MANGHYCIELFIFIVATLSFATGYEKCTYGTFYYQCYSGRCCQINGNWYCTHGSLYRCTRLAETTRPPRRTVNQQYKTELTTTLKYRTGVLDKATESGANAIVPVTVSLIGLSAVILFIIFVFCLHKKRNCHSNNRPVQRRPPVSSSRPRCGLDNHVFFMDGTNSMLTMPDTDFSRYLPSDLPPSYDEIDQIKPPAYYEIVQQNGSTNTDTEQQNIPTSEHTVQQISSTNQGTTQQNNATNSHIVQPNHTIGS